jgi:hypothetical protein
MTLMKARKPVQRERPSDSFFFYVPCLPTYPGKHLSHSAYPDSYVSRRLFRPEITPLHCNLRPKTLCQSALCHTFPQSDRPCNSKPVHADCLINFVSIFDPDCHSFETFPSISMSISSSINCAYFI